MAQNQPEKLAKMICLIRLIRLIRPIPHQKIGIASNPPIPLNSRFDAVLLVPLRRVVHGERIHSIFACR